MAVKQNRKPTKPVIYREYDSDCDDDFDTAHRIRVANENNEDPAGHVDYKYGPKEREDDQPVTKAREIKLVGEKRTEQMRLAQKKGNRDDYAVRAKLNMDTHRSPLVTCMVGKINTPKN